MSLVFAVHMSYSPRLAQWRETGNEGWDTHLLPQSKGLSDPLL
jgi:hypothetical protein